MAAVSFLRTCAKASCLRNATGTLLKSAPVTLKGQYAMMSIIEGYNKHRKTWKKTFLKEMYEKRCEIGPDRPRKRSEWINWNYDIEIYAFGKRLGEEFDEETLRLAFVHRSHLEHEKAKRSDLGLDTDTLTFDMEDNSELASKGEELMSTYVRSYLRNIYPYMFEECISSLHDHLMSDEVLSNVSLHLGVEDMVLCEEFPPVQQSTLSVTFKAVVGALEESQGREQAERFVRDFVLPQLQGKDINEMWSLHNPMGLLGALLALTGKGAPEPRMLWKSASNTLMANYWVGIYSDRQLLAKAPGETLSIAEEMAARESIKKIQRTEDYRKALVLGSAADTLVIDFDRVNASAENIIKKHFELSKSKNKGEAIQS